MNDRSRGLPLAPALGSAASVLDHVADAVACCEPDATIVYANAAAEELLGASPVGASLWDRVGEEREALQLVFERVAATGVRQRFEHVTRRTRRWFETSMHRENDRVWIFSRDVSERRAIATRLETLVEATRVFSEAALDPSTMFDAIARHVGRAVRGACSVRLVSVDADRLLEAPAGAWAEDDRVAVLREAIADAAEREAARTGRTVSLHGRDLASGLAPAAIERLDVQGVLVTPLRARGDRIGVLTAFRMGAPPFGPEEAQLLEELAERAALVIGQWRSARLQQRAEEVQRRWEQVFHHASWGMSLATPDSRFIVVNRAFAEMHGTTTEHWAGRSLGDMFAPESKSLLDELARRLHESGHMIYESIHLRADGSKFPVLAEVTAFKDENGRVLFRAANFQDITARKEAERALEHERSKLARLLESAPFAVALHEGPDHVTRFSNAKHAEMTGGRVVVGRPLAESLPDLPSAIRRTLDEVHATGVTKTAREVHTPTLRDGRVEDRWYDVTWQAVHEPDGTVSGVLVSSVEVTDHVVARRELEAAQRLTEAITSNATLGLIMMDSRQRCTFMNPAAEQITGFRMEEVREKPLHDYVHHSHPDGTPYPMEECPIDRALPTKNQERGEDVFVHKDGRFYPVAFTASPILENGRPVGTVIELRDTTEEKAAQKERERILEELRAAIAVRDEFLSIASHELRTPLAALSLQLDGILRAFGKGLIDPPRVEQKLGVARRHAEQLTRLIDGLLDVSRISTGRFRVERVEIDLAALVREVTERHGEEARRFGVTLQVQAPERVVGAWDRTGVDQVLTNLLTNALKYGTGKPVLVSLEDLGERVAIAVRDEGIGIAAEDLPRIFGRFERAVPSKNYGGLGLGLYIAHQIVVAHGGTIEVASEPGVATTFTVLLPRTRPSLT